MILKREKSCGAIVYRMVNEKPQILLIKHKNGGHWSFPKGHIEVNETEQETALREIKEETGLDVMLNEKFRTSVAYRPKPDIDKEVVYFLAEVSGGVLKKQESEISRAEWVDIETAQKIVTFDNDKMLVIKAKKFLY